MPEPIDPDSPQPMDPSAAPGPHGLNELPDDLSHHLLIASPAIGQGIFYRSVVMLANHSPAAGAMGVILNRPTGRTIYEVFPSPDFLPIREVAVCHGGPVETQGITFGVISQVRQQVRINLNVSDVAPLAKHLRKPPTIVRAFAGHSGWAPGQLEAELRSGSWIVAKPGTELLTIPHDQHLWSNMLRQLSPYHRILAEAPADPLVN